jgi:zinc protease
MRSFVLYVLLAALAVPAAAQSAAAPAPKPFGPNDPIPADPALKIGKLDNGLTYYIMRNGEPKNRAELRLAVNTGSILEDPNERGLAHFLEHMLFNGTRRFKGPELINFLERIGMEFGPDINASTSFDETVYQLKIATDDKKTVETAFDVLEDWAGYATLATEDIDKERGIIVEEWRQRDKTVGGRMRDKILPALFGDSRYTSRLPIGDMEIIRTAPAERFRDFYKRWYRPDLMAVVAVGDFDPAWIEGLIKQRFSSLTNPASPVARTAYPVPGHEGTRVRIVTDPENPSTGFQVTFRHDARPTKTVADLREDFEWALFRDMLNTRLDEVSRKADAPFLGAGVSKQNVVRSVDFYAVSGQAHEGKVLQSIDVVMTEVERARRHGFTATELQRAKDEIMRSYERLYAERDKINSAALVNDFVTHFLTGEATPSIDASYALAKQIIPSVTLADANAKVAELVSTNNRVLLVTAPEKAGLATPTETEIAAAFDRVKSKQIEPYVDAVTASSLMEKAPAPVAIAKEREIPEIGVTEVVLANGVRVLMKQTDFKNDQVLFNSWSPGGTSLVSDTDLTEARLATAVAGQSGVGAFDLTALQKVLTGKQVGVAPNITETGEGFSGSASPKDLETLFQLVYLYATAPRIDRSAFDLVKTQLRSVLQNRSLTPGAALDDAVREALYGKSPRVGPPTLEDIDTLDFDRLAAIYRDRFADLGDSTFVFVGSFDPATLKTLARTYLGTLPSTARKEAWRDVSADPAGGVIERTVRKGKDERSVVQIIFSGPAKTDEEARTLVTAIERVLSIRVREELREERGGVYSPGVQTSVQKTPDEEYSVVISFSCDPKRADELAAAVFTIVDDLQKNGPSADVLAKVKEQGHRAIEEGSRTNGYWLGSLARLATAPGGDLLEVTRFDGRVAALTAEKIRDAMRLYLPRDRYVKAVLQPEAPPAQPAAGG